jgi:hypothetical protein
MTDGLDADVFSAISSGMGRFDRSSKPKTE